MHFPKDSFPDFLFYLTSEVRNELIVLLFIDIILLLFKQRDMGFNLCDL